MKVRASTGESLISLAKYLNPESQKLFFIPIISKLSSNSKDEEHRIDAAEVIIYYYYYYYYYYFIIISIP